MLVSPSGLPASAKLKLANLRAAADEALSMAQAVRAGGQMIHVEQHNTFNNPQSAVLRMMKNRKLVRQMATDIGRHMTLNPSTRGSY